VTDDDWYEDEDGDTGWTSAAVKVTDENHKVRVLSERCTTCILGGERSITPRLARGRLKDLITRAADGHIPCHSTLSNTDPHAAICAGWFETFGMESNYIRVMGRLGGLVFVPAPEKDGAS
jgi:hypothetical protein